MFWMDAHVGSSKPCTATADEVPTRSTTPWEPAQPSGPRRSGTCLVLRQGPDDAAP